MSFSSIGRYRREVSGMRELHQGFARVRCPDCHHEYFLAFSCRGRWFCPSCHVRRCFPYERKVIKKILDHHSIYGEDKSKRNRAPPASPDFLERIIEQYDDGWPDYEDPFVDVQTI